MKIKINRDWVEFIIMVALAALIAYLIIEVLTYFRIVL